MRIKIKENNRENLWYYNKVGEVYELEFTTLTAFYVRMPLTNPVPIEWVYKQDCEVL